MFLYNVLCEGCHRNSFCIDLDILPGDSVAATKWTSINHSSARLSTWHKLQHLDRIKNKNRYYPTKTDN